MTAFQKIKFSLYKAIILAFALCLIPTISQAKVFNAETFTLDNGLEVILIPNHRAPVVTSMIWYKVGAADEKAGLSGMAHYFEHLMFKGTKTLKPGEFSRIVKKLGGNDNAFTGQDYTAYFQTIARQHLDKMLTMEADRMVNLDVPADHFKSEKKVVIEERRQRTENDPKGLFYEQLRSALFINHPYGTPTIGWMSEIKDYKWEDVKKFYDAWYAPNNAVIVISGDVTAKTIRPLIEKHFASIPAKKLPNRVRPSVPKAIGETKMILKHPSIHEPSFSKIFIAPPFAKNKKDSLALQILQQILSGGPTTRLYKSIVVDQGKAVSAGFSYNPTALDYGTISLYGTPKGDTTLEELIALIEGEIQDIQINGITEKELSDAKKQLIDSAVYARDSLSGPAMIIGYEITTGSTLNDVEHWPEMIQSVTIEDVQRVTKTYLDKNEPWVRPAVTGYIYPQADKVDTEDTQ